MIVAKRRILRKNVLNYGMGILIALLLSISFIGESTGNISLDSGLSTDSTSINDGKVDLTSDEPSTDTSVKEQNDQTNDISSDSTDTSTQDSTTTKDNTIDLSNSKDDAIQVNTSDTTIIDTLTNITETNNSVSILTQLTTENIDVNSDTLEYWLNQFNLTDIDEELKARFLTLMDKAAFITELKIKMLSLLNDGTLNEEELKIRLLNYIRTVSLNEREVSIEEIASKVELVCDDNIVTCKKAQVLMNELDQDIGIEKVQFTAKRNLSNIKVSIIKLKQKPEDIPLRLSRNKTVYQYMDIKLLSEDEYVSDDDIETLTFTFKVDLTWIAENNIDKDTIILTRYHDGEWQNLTTIKLSENETCISFKAETPGCSTFAVVGSTLVEIPEPYVFETPEIPWMVIIGVIASTTIILVTVLFKARYIYFEESPHKTKYVFYEGDPHKLKSKNNNIPKNNNFNRKVR